MGNRLFCDVHVLQSLPPSCVNRDDTGSPKTAIYGGVTRSRVSSQSWKRAMRLYFKEIFADEEIGIRTKKVKQLLVEELSKHESIQEPEKIIEEILTHVDSNAKKDKSDTLFFISKQQMEALVNLALENPKGELNKEDVKRAYNSKPSIDMALFGRMVAKDQDLNTDASSQVAHAISTHAVSNEYDYFTAVDDIDNEEHAGAGHIGTTEYNSSTVYRYATVAVHDLYDQLGDDVPRVVKGFIEAFVKSMPTGKQNSFANRTLPSLVLVNMRTDQPINLVAAFEQPIYPGESGFIKPSAKQLESYETNLYKSMASKPSQSFLVHDGSIITNRESIDLNTLFEEAEAYIEEYANNFEGE
ncbi:type I-E CRISPR-associated protein Cas7/Cse4/CasC [Gudongella oleilytica]|uniref:type I-E CRISPR-associated protein Cas7/Cse4/CasC n=1 Tax=Gudongella oleilytica TaxID=1582259 RepID=UPI000FF89841|nr:type I-E CRISPR-associated protein Cas7/Cse4/CasC [Gudongella oleilytica]